MVVLQTSAYKSQPFGLGYQRQNVFPTFQQTEYWIHLEICKSFCQDSVLHHGHSAEHLRTRTSPHSSITDSWEHQIVHSPTSTSSLHKLCRVMVGWQQVPFNSGTPLAHEPNTASIRIICTITDPITTLPPGFMPKPAQSKQHTFLLSDLQPLKKVLNNELVAWNPNPTTQKATHSEQM